MTTMNAIEITAPGGPEVLQSCTRPRPVPNADQVIIRVSYAGVNRPDALQRAGLYNPPAGASDLPGLEASGTVVEIGETYPIWRLGIVSVLCFRVVDMRNMWRHLRRIVCQFPQGFQ